MLRPLLVDATSDHDLLVRLDAKLDALSVQFSEVRSSVSTKAEAGRVDRLEAQINSMEHKVYMATGGLLSLQIILKFFHL